MEYESILLRHKELYTFCFQKFLHQYSISEFTSYFLFLLTRGWFHKKRLFGNNYPVTCHFWQLLLPLLPANTKPKNQLFTTFGTSYLPLLAVNIKTISPFIYHFCHFEIDLLTTFGTSYLPLLAPFIYHFCH